MSRLKVFLSYSSADVQIATDYKLKLEKYYGFKVFVSHHDNTPSTDWAENIKESIRSADIFLVLVSKNSKESTYVNQEIGMAWGLGIKIFPIKISTENPFGFISTVQGLPFIDDYEKSILVNGSKIFSILTSDAEFLLFGEIAVESTIYALANSPNWSDSNIIIKTLIESEKKEGFNFKHLEQLENACNSNYEVYGGANAYPGIKKLLEDKYSINSLR